MSDRKPHFNYRRVRLLVPLYLAEFNLEQGELGTEVSKSTIVFDKVYPHEVHLFPFDYDYIDDPDVYDSPIERGHRALMKRLEDDGFLKDDERNLE